MELNEYQERAMSTCMKSCNNTEYMLMNLVGEVGEFASKWAKAIRKGNINIRDNDYCPSLRMTGEDVLTFETELKKEAGDILWQLSGLCSVMGWKFEDVALMNLDKLASRKERGVIDGNGDNR